MGYINIDSIGDRAIACTMLELIKQKIGTADITFLTGESSKFKEIATESIKERVNVQDIITKFPDKYSYQWLADLIPRKILLRNLNPKLFLNRKFYNAADIYISIGTDTYTDCYGSPSFFFESTAFAKKRKALTMISAASIGPFYDKYFEQKWAKELQKVDLITVRETLSLEYLRQLGAVRNIKLVADPAFLLSPDSKGTILLDQYKPNNIIGLNMSDLIARYGTSREQYLEAFKCFVEYLLLDKNNIIILIPHNYGTRKYQDDFLVCRSLFEKLGKKERVILINEDYSASQLKYIISKCGYFFGARTHATIASLSSLVPTISIAYSRKAYGINQDIFGHSDYVLPIKNINESKLIEKYELLRDNRGAIFERLKKIIPEMKILAVKNIDYLVELLKKHGFIL
jgi:polysaccharide pyruvyl transferase WcaK-like protein